MKLYVSLIILSLAQRVICDKRIGVDQTNLPAEAVFPGVWDKYIQAPADKGFIRPRAVKTIEGDVGSRSENLLVVRNEDGTEERRVVEEDGKGEEGQKPIAANWPRDLTMGRGGLIVFDFEENIAGRYARFLLSRLLAVASSLLHL